MLQVDVFVKDSVYNLDKISNRIDELLMPDTITGTRGWHKLSQSEYFEDDIQAHHKAIRFMFEYTVTDS